MATLRNTLRFLRAGMPPLPVAQASIKLRIAILDFVTHRRGRVWYLKSHIKVWLSRMIGEAHRGVHLMGPPVARERDNERCHGFMWSQGELVTDCVESPEFSNSSTFPFVSKRKVMFRNSRRKGQCHPCPQLQRFGVKRRILGLVRSRHFIGQPPPCVKRTTHLSVDAHAR